MLVFALLCPFLIWPMHRHVARFGFSMNTYVVSALLMYVVAVGIAYALLLIAPRLASTWMSLPLGAIFLNHLAFLAIGDLSRPDEVAARQERHRVDEVARRDRLAAVEAEAEAWPCLKTYVSGSQQYEYLSDRRLLDANTLRYVVRSSLITNLHVHPDDGDRAAELLGVAL